MTKRAIETGLPHSARPHEWAIMAGNTLYTAASPINPDGSRETGSAERQATVALANLAQVMEAAGGTLADVVQAMLYVTDASYIDPISDVWAKTFPKPYPNRATVIVNAIGMPGAKLVIMAQAYLPPRRKKKAPRPGTAG